MFSRFETSGNLRMMKEEEHLSEMYLNQVWNPNMSVYAVSGLPTYQQGLGGTMPTYSSCRLYFNLPPNLDPMFALRVIEDKITKDVPYNCKVTLK